MSHVAGRGRGNSNLLALVVALGAACGGAKPVDGGGGPKPVVGAAPQDLDFTFTDTQIEGGTTAPEALGLPGMTKVSKGKTTLAAQRKKVAKQPGASDVQILVTLLWAEADSLACPDKVASDSAAGSAGRCTDVATGRFARKECCAGADAKQKLVDDAKKLHEEGRAALRALVAAKGDKADAVSLQMLATAELWLGDDAAAAKAYEALLARFPQAEGAMSFRTWLAAIDLRQGKVADAARLTAGWKPEEVGDLAAYAQAWTAFAQRDYPTAITAIVAATKAWKDVASRPAVERDLLLMLARGGAEVPAASQALGDLAGGNLKQRYVWMFGLSEAYKQAGYYDRAAATLDVLIDDVLKGQVPPEDLVAFRYRQADYAFRTNQAAVAADRAIAAYQGLAACADKCKGETAEAVTSRLPKLAQLSHTIYVTTQDPAHYAAAIKLYDFYLALPGRADAETVKGYRKNLVDTKATIDPASGKHTDKMMVDLVKAHQEVLVACYDAVLVAEPKLEGTIKLSFEVSDKGEVTGATTEPGGGAEGLAAVGQCLTDRVKSWSFPSRTVAGTTRVHLPLGFHPKTASAAPTPAAP